MFTFYHLFVLLWATIGSSLGFWAIRYDSFETPKTNILRWLQSVSCGCFIALFVFEFMHIKLNEPNLYSTMVSGLVAFGGPDAVLKIVNRWVDKISG